MSVPDGQLGNAGQRSILDIQKEEAERTRAQREAAEKSAAAAGLPMPSPAPGGWAKIAGGGAGTGGNSMSPSLASPVLKRSIYTLSSLCSGSGLAEGLELASLCSPVGQARLHLL